MATATQIQLSSSPSLTTKPELDDGVKMEDMVHLAGLCRTSLNALNLNLPDLNLNLPYTADEIVQLPLDKHRVPDALFSLPRRKSARHAEAEALCRLLDPAHDGSLSALIRYDADRVRLRAWAALQRKYDRLIATKLHGRTTMGLSGGVGPGIPQPAWSSRITGQGPWDPVKKPISLDGCPAIPMPVQVAHEDELAPFFEHLQNGGTDNLDGIEDAVELDDGRGEPHYGVHGAEFRKGVVYEDGRMDLCKMVVGPDHIWKLMESLRSNKFVRHFLLGNNIIGPSGAAAIAKFIHDLPGQIETWYIAGNCINGASFTPLVDALITSPAVRQVWLKRNPLGSGAAHDLFRLITQTENLNTLDLDQTELGDAGVAELFTELAAYKGPDGFKLPLRNMYMNGCGISTKASQAIASFLSSPHCGLESLYMSCNPIGNDGALALASALRNAPCLARLSLQSVGASTQGVTALCEALAGHPGIRSIDLGQAFATQDLGQAYNYIEEDALPSIARMIQSTPRLEYLNLAHCPVTPPQLASLLAPAILESPSLLYYSAFPILPDPTKTEPTFRPSRDQTLVDPGQRSKLQVASEKAIRAHLEAHVRARYGEEMTYVQFLADEKRWLVNDREVRKIDSVYRNRDAGLARRHLMTLVKDWDEDDRTLDEVMKVVGPVCTLRRR
ncbi:unnamed protein product [Clonostachys chloroleuca]|uniref:RNI-like protein n=1 Tax=Clonostachys chloroleuca TaxID=1926264 RepID=A0AA35Q6I0_9HYPO|nr:unnamed protein product [Clonostachys chloroleuca]